MKRLVAISIAACSLTACEMSTLPPELDPSLTTQALAVPPSIVDLGTLGGASSSAQGVNEAGQIVGFSSLSGEAAEHAVLWDNGGITDLGTLGGAFSHATAINEEGQVVGESLLSGESNVQHAFLWEAGTMTDLGTLGGAQSAAYAINDVGQIVGVSTLASGAQHAFLWEDGTMRDLGTLGGTNSIALGINNSGQVVGLSEMPGGGLGAAHAFLWQAGSMIDLGTIGGSFSVGAGINNAGEVVGGSTRIGDAIADAFLWRNGAMTTLVLAVAGSSGNGINDLSHIVGSYFPFGDFSEERAFLWEDDVSVDLGSLGGTKSVAYGINNAGKIVGQSTLDDALAAHAVVWTILTRASCDDGGWAALGFRNHGQCIRYVTTGKDSRSGT